MPDLRPTSQPPSDRSQADASSQSVLLLERFRAGDEAAATELFERFAKRLASLVQSRLSSKLARRLDAEDVVLSAYRSFFVRARDGQFAIDEPGELWRLLAQIALNKLHRSAARHNAARRSLNREQDDIVDLANRAADAASSPDLEVIVADQLEHLMSQLPEATCRVLELRLQGHDVDEIAGLIDRSPRTVRRQLETVRVIFLKLAGAEVVDRSESESLHQKPEARAVQVQADMPSPGLRSNEALAENRTLNDFVLRRQIGLGLTGRVYEAFDKRQQQLVAVKVLRKSLLSDRSLRERFEAEADIVARLTHPGIVRIHGHGETPNRGWFLVMDLLPNGDLTPYAGNSLPIKQAVDWVREVATAIGYAHGAGVIHCDLKPANLLLSMDGHVVVTDFGFAQAHEVLGRSASCIAGTPAFMAPEQIDAAWGHVGPQTDIYGLGAVLFFLLTGSPPVVGIRMSEIFEQVTSASEIQVVIDLRPDVPSWLADVCHRCLRKRSSERFQSTEAVITALQRSLGSGAS